LGAPFRSSATSLISIKAIVQISRVVYMQITDETAAFVVFRAAAEPLPFYRDVVAKRATNTKLFA
jgi:hypothetical protein